MRNDLDIEPWNEPTPPASNSTRRRAATWVWAIAAVELALAGCCAAMFLRLAAMPHDQIESLMNEGGASSQQLAMVMQARTYATSMAVAYGLLGTVPALALAGAAFGVSRGRRWAVMLCLVIVLMQLIVTGGFLLMVIAVAFSSGQPAQFTMGVIMLGSFIAALVFTFKQLLAARQPGEDGDSFTRTDA